ncbi:MAG: RNA ligase family protein [Candidatus Doudnabacteria bacterium]
MERKLAHIEKIEWIKPIEGADAIELCGVLGWQCVIAKKDNFKVDDVVVYIEVDSVVPERPEFEFLRDRKFRVRTIKLRGQVSQGLVLPIKCLPDKSIKHGDPLGFDVTDILGITKYLTPSEQDEISKQEEAIKLEKNRLKKYMMRYSWFRRIFLSRKQKSGFPYWVSKTDEERIQNLGNGFIEQNKDKVVYVTEKIDYQSGTWTSKSVPKFSGLLGKLLPIKKTLFVVASRNLQTNDKSSLYWKIAEKYNLESICKKYAGIIIQGEQGNTKVQGNKYSLKEPKMWIFNIVMPDGKMLDYPEMESFCKENKLDIVPYLGFFKLSEIGLTVNDFVEFAKGKSTLANIHREGVVIRCIESGKKLISFKSINPDFLLKYDN